jgi:prefoldin subunit 5
MVEAWQRELQSINAQIAEVQKAINETKSAENKTEEK